MVGDDTKLPTFNGNWSKDLKQHEFLCEVVWTIKQVQDDNVKRAYVIMTFQVHSLYWFMKFSIIVSRCPQNTLVETKAGVKRQV